MARRRSPGRSPVFFPEYAVPLSPMQQPAAWFSRPVPVPIISSAFQTDYMAGKYSVPGSMQNLALLGNW